MPKPPKSPIAKNGHRISKKLYTKLSWEIEGCLLCAKGGLETALNNLRQKKHILSWQGNELQHESSFQYAISDLKTVKRKFHIYSEAIIKYRELRSGDYPELEKRHKIIDDLMNQVGRLLTQYVVEREMEQELWPKDGTFDPWEKWRNVEKTQEEIMH
jgi:DNA repair ATPase RecN